MRCPASTGSPTTSPRSHRAPSSGSRPLTGDALAGYRRTTFAAAGKEREVLETGAGPAVVVIHEMPGVTPPVAAFGRRVAESGFTAVLPVLFGEPGRPFSFDYWVPTLAWGCVSREFSTFAAGRTSPVTSWLRALARDAHERCGGPGVGVVGMCWTGGFALGMLADREVLAPVLSQPSLPLGLTRRHRADPGVSPEDMAVARQRVSEGLCVLGLRFSHDRLSPPERFETLRRELGDGFVAVEIDSSPGNPHGIPAGAHSVLTEHLVDEPGHPTLEALERVLDLFRERLAAR